MIDETRSRGSIWSTIFRGIRDSKDWLLSGTGEWEPVPGRPSRDAAYVRAVVFRVEDVADAADLLIRIYKQDHPELVDEDLKATWSHSTFGLDPGQPEEVNIDLAQIDELSDEERNSMRVSVFGALLEFGRSVPATAYWGDDASKKRVVAAYEFLRERGRLRVQARRLLRISLALLFIMATIVTVAASLWGTVTTAALWLFLPALFLAVVSVAEAIVRVRTNPRARLSHRLLSPGPK